jgi:hypothetical protein
MHKQQKQHLKSNNNIISKLAVIVLSIVLLTGISIVPALQIGVNGQVQQQEQQHQEPYAQEEEQMGIDSHLLSTTTIAASVDNASNNNSNNNVRRGFDLQDNSGNYIFDINNCSNIANSSGINGMSECEFAEYETAKERALIDNQDCQAILPDGTCIPFFDEQGNPIEMDEDLDDAPRFNTSIGFDELGRQIWYCTHDVIIVGMPCGPLESPEEKERNDQFGRDIGNNNNTTLPRWIDLPRSINDCKTVNGILECPDVEIIEEEQEKEIQQEDVAASEEEEDGGGDRDDGGDGGGDDGGGDDGGDGGDGGGGEE